MAWLKNTRKFVQVAMVASACTALTAAHAQSKEHGRYALSGPIDDSGYKLPVFDLSGLPSYKPTEGITGTVRIAGTPLDSLIGNWANAFKEYQKRARFTTYLTNTSQALAALTQNKADIGVMGHATWHDSRVGFRTMYGYDPLEVKFAKGSFDDPDGSTPAIVFFVHKNNPLTSISIDQIDGIFGAQRTGGWDGIKWTTAAARGPEKDIRTWDKMGLTGNWSGRPIHVYGTDVTLSNWADLIEKIAFRGGTKWNPALHEGPRADVIKGTHDKQIIGGVANDPDGIGFMFQRVINAMKADVKVIPVVDRQGRVITPSNASVFDSTYPFHNAVYLYFNRKPGTPMDHAQRELARYVLSREGQEIIAKDRRFIPLNADEIREERRKLD
jgi:phosphate transport system substrate-binding protein